MTRAAEATITAEPLEIDADADAPVDRAAQGEQRSSIT